MALGQVIENVSFSSNGLGETAEAKLRAMKFNSAIGFRWQVPVDVSSKLMPLQAKLDRYAKALSLHKNGGKGKDGKPFVLSEKEQIAVQLGEKQVAEERLAIIRKAMNTEGTGLRNKINALAAKIAGTRFDLSVKPNNNLSDCIFAVTCIALADNAATADSVIDESNLPD